MPFEVNLKRHFVFMQFSFYALFAQSQISVLSKTVTPWGCFFANVIIALARTSTGIGRIACIIPRRASPLNSATVISSNMRSVFGRTKLGGQTIDNEGK